MYVFYVSLKPPMISPDDLMNELCFFTLVVCWRNRSVGYRCVAEEINRSVVVGMPEILLESVYVCFSHFQHFVRTLRWSLIMLVVC